MQKAIQPARVVVAPISREARVHIPVHPSLLQLLFDFLLSRSMCLPQLFGVPVHHGLSAVRGVLLLPRDLARRLRHEFSMQLFDDFLVE